MLRRARNYYSTKLIPDIPRRVNSKPIYLRKYRPFTLGKSSSLFNKFKYEIGQDIYFDKDPLPNAYFVNEIVLMPKNKNTLFAYWEVREEDFKFLKEEKSVSDDMIILLFVKGEFYRKISGLSRNGSYYISNVLANREYTAVIGFENERGEFFEIAKSNKVYSPFGRVSTTKARTWGIPYVLEDGSISIKTYTKDNLPNEFYLNQEILDDEILKSGYNVERTYDENKFLGSSASSIIK